MGDALRILLAQRPVEKKEEPRDERDVMLDAAGGALVGAMKAGDGRAVGKILKDILSIAKE